MKTKTKILLACLLGSLFLKPGERAQATPLPK